MATSNGIEIPWPKLKKKLNLNVETVILSQILLISKLLSLEECNELIQSIHNHQTGLGAFIRFETTNQIPRRGEAFRFNDRISVYDPHFAQIFWLQTGLNIIFNNWFTCFNAQDDILSKKNCWGLNPNIRIYRYQVGHKFEKHFDDSVKIYTVDNTNLRESLAIQAQSNWNDNHSKKNFNCSEVPDFLSTEYTLLIYLTGSEISNKDSNQKEKLNHSKNKLTNQILEGGETVFYSQDHFKKASQASKKHLDHSIKKSKGSNQDKQVEDQSILASIKPISGLALIHRHGSKCLLHEGREVTSGVKYVLRSDIMFG